MTNPDETRQLYELTDQQRRAAHLLVEGKTVTEAAERVGVARQTVANWRNHHPATQALMNRLRIDAYRDCVDLVRNIDSEALRLVGVAVESGDLKAALAWLRARPAIDANGMSSVGDERSARAIVERDAEEMERERWDNLIGFKPAGGDGMLAAEQARLRGLREES